MPRAGIGGLPVPARRYGYALAGLRSQVEPKEHQIRLRPNLGTPRHLPAGAQGRRLTLRVTPRAYRAVRRRARFENMSMEFYVFRLLHEWLASDAEHFGPNGYDGTRRGLWDAMERMSVESGLRPGRLVADALDVWASDL